MLGQLDESGQERLELRLITDPVFVDEFDTVVDEITDQYVAGELKLGERERVEQYFLRARVRRDKVKFASALINHASESRSDKRQAPAPVAVELRPAWGERLLAFWSNQSLTTRVAAAMVSILVMAGVAFLLFSGSGTVTFAHIELAISHGDRAEGPQTEPVKLTPEIDALRIRLRLPEEFQNSKGYRVESVNQSDVRKELEIVERDEQTITVIAPVSDLPSGRYGIQLTAINPEGTEQRIPGTYRLEIEAGDSR